MNAKPRECKLGGLNEHLDLRIVHSRHSQQLGIDVRNAANWKDEVNYSTKCKTSSFDAGRIRVSRLDLRGPIFWQGILGTPANENPRLIKKDKFGTHLIIRDPITGLKILS